MDESARFVCDSGFLWVDMGLVEVKKKLLEDWVSEGKDDPASGEEYETPGKERSGEEENEGGGEKKYENC